MHRLFSINSGILVAVVLCAARLLCQDATDPLGPARALLSEGKLQDTESTLRAYLASHPTSADAHFLLGYALFRDQKPNESLVEFTEGAKFRRPHPDELKIVASDYVILSDYMDADKWFSTVVTESPNDADACISSAGPSSTKITSPTPSPISNMPWRCVPNTSRLKTTLA